MARDLYHRPVWEPSPVKQNRICKRRRGPVGLSRYDIFDLAAYSTFESHLMFTVSYLMMRNWRLSRKTGNL